MNIVERKKIERLERKHSLLVEAIDNFLDNQRDSCDVHDWSECRSDDAVEQEVKKTKHSTSDAGCAYATLEEKVRKYR